MQRLDELYDFVDFLKRKNDAADISVSLITELRGEYNDVKRAVAGQLSSEQIVKKLKFVMSCEYQTLLKKFMSDGGNVSRVLQDAGLLRMLTESVIEVAAPPELPMPAEDARTEVAREEKGVQLSGVRESGVRSEGNG